MPCDQPYEKLGPSESSLSSPSSASRQRYEDEESEDARMNLHTPGYFAAGRSKVLSIALVCSIGLCLVLTAVVIKLLATQHKGLPEYEHPTSLGIIHTPGVRPPILGPEFPLVTKTFIKDFRYIGSPDEVFDMWKPLLFRANNGTISFKDDSEPFYGIAGYHQMHCVWLYVKMIDLAVTGVKPDAELEKHTRHCAEYLRQAVMCHADNTLERNYKGILGAFAANNTHVCRDWDKLMEWADENAYTGNRIS